MLADLQAKWLVTTGFFPNIKPNKSRGGKPVDDLPPWVHSDWSVFHVSTTNLSPCTLGVCSPLPRHVLGWPEILGELADPESAEARRQRHEAAVHLLKGLPSPPHRHQVGRNAEKLRGAVGGRPGWVWGNTRGRCGNRLHV